MGKTSNGAKRSGSALATIISIYFAIAILIVFVIFLVSSSLQLERGLVEQERIAQNLEEVILEDYESPEITLLLDRYTEIGNENRTLRLRNSLITVGASTVLGLILVVILSVLARRTKELYRQRAQTESTLLSIGDGLIVTDAWGRIILVNDTFEEALGISLKEIKGKKLTKTVPFMDEKGNEAPRSKWLVSKALRSGERSSTTVYYQRKDGTIFPAAVTVAPIVVGRKISGAVEVFRDITKQKEIERAKDTFISIASHQLRTPLTSIRWFLDTLVSGKAGEIKGDQLEIIKEAHNSVLRLNAIVAELLNVGRIETGRLQVKPELIDVVELCEDIVRELKPQYSEKKVIIKKEFQEGLPEIKVDPLIIRQVILNIISNAVKYSDRGGKIFVSAKKEKEFIRMEIKDKGIGIPREEQDSIFGRFYRATNATDVKEADGTGLGLFLAKKLVELSGGEIGFVSEENKGTTFWFTLPLSGSEEQEGEVALSTSR